VGKIRYNETLARDYHLYYQEHILEEKMTSKNYKLTPAFFKMLERRFYFVAAPIALVTLVGGFFIASRNAEFNFSVAVVGLLILVVVVFGFRNSLNNQKQNWASYRLNIEPDSISKIQDNFETVKIFKDEITGITEYAGGSVVIHSGNKQIIIPATLEDFSEVRSLIGQWYLIDVVKSQNGLNILIMISAAVLPVIAFGVVLISNQPFLVLTTGSILLIALISSIFLVQRSSTADNKIKRTIWWVLIPILFIVIRIYILLFAE